jgi:hypothetical protein
VSEQIALECVKIAATLVSPSVNDRFEGIAQISEKLYLHIQKLSGEALIEVTPEATSDKPRRGRPPIALRKPVLR